MWSSRPYIPPAPFISGERTGLEFWFTLATLAGRSDSSTRQPALFAQSGFARGGRGSAEGDLGEDLAEDAVALGPDPLGPLLVTGVQHRRRAATASRPRRVMRTRRARASWSATATSTIPSPVSCRTNCPHPWVVISTQAASSLIVSPSGGSHSSTRSCEGRSSGASSASRRGGARRPCPSASAGAARRPAAGP